jgi:excinuclease ABC subunit C
VESVTDRDQDVLGLYREGDLAELSVMYVRSGRVVEVVSFSNKRVEMPDDELVAGFLREHYAGPTAIPDEVLLPVLPEGALGVAEWLSDRRQEQGPPGVKRAGRTQLLAPARGPRKQLLEMATENARHAFAEKQRAREDIVERLGRVQQRLRLPALPRKVECCDISHLGGKDTVGSIVAFCDGEPDKKRYKSYNVKSVSDGDDYGAMYEVLSRRFRRGRDASEESDWGLPDLFVVDGGPGQLAVALAAAQDLGLEGFNVVALAKEREKPLSDKLVDRIYLPGQKNPIPLKANSGELFFLAHARDEAHRFANRARKRLGKKRRFASELDAIPGIGPKTKKALLKNLGSPEKIRQASDDTILAVPGVSRAQLKALREHLAN